MVLLGAIALTLEITSNVCGMFLTGQNLLDHHWLDYAFMYERRYGLFLQGFALGFTFFGRGMSRLMFIVALTLICMVW